MSRLVAPNLSLPDASSFCDGFHFRMLYSAIPTQKQALNLPKKAIMLGTHLNCLKLVAAREV